MHIVLIILLIKRYVEFIIKDLTWLIFTDSWSLFDRSQEFNCGDAFERSIESSFNKKSSRKIIFVEYDKKIFGKKFRKKIFPEKENL